MTSEEQLALCKAIAISCMWGQGGIASVILERFQEAIPTTPSWQEVERSVSREARREHMGVIKDEDQLRGYLRRGYWLTNGDSLFNPPPMNGLCMYVSKELYDKFTAGRGY